MNRDPANTLHNNHVNAERERHANSFKPGYKYTPDRCPSKHWNDGSDVCADCGEDLQK